MPTADELQALETQHRRIAVVRAQDDITVTNPDGTKTTRPEWEVVLRRPDRKEYKQLRAQSHNPATLADAQEITVRKLIVYPVGTAVDVLLDDFPGIPEACGAALLRLSGAAGREDVQG